MRHHTRFSRKAELKDELGIQPQTECLFLLKGVLLKPRDVLSRCPESVWLNVKSRLVIYFIALRAW